MPGVTTQLCLKTFGSMCNGANDADDPARWTRVHVGPMDDYVDQEIAVQIVGYTIETQATKSTLVGMTRG